MSDEEIKPTESAETPSSEATPATGDQPAVETPAEGAEKPKEGEGAEAPAGEGEAAQPGDNQE